LAAILAMSSTSLAAAFAKIQDTHMPLSKSILPQFGQTLRSVISTGDTLLVLSALRRSGHSVVVGTLAAHDDEKRLSHDGPKFRAS
jgi:hypothetical protein